MWINSLPNKNDISQEYSTSEIATQCKMDFRKHCQCEFIIYLKSRGDYVVTKNMTQRTHKAITLGPSGNLQGTHKLICFKTGLLLKWRINTAVPMPYRVINKMTQ